MTTIEMFYWLTAALFGFYAMVRTHALYQPGIPRVLLAGVLCAACPPLALLMAIRWEIVELDKKADSLNDEVEQARKTFEEDQNIYTAQQKIDGEIV